jgi:glycosyltransferase involved in cell wall biosynthesis
MPHHRRDGVVVGWGPTVHEIDHLTEIFEEVRHVGLLHPGEAPTSALPYRSPRVTFIPAPPAGGNRLADKLNILLRYPGYWRLMLRELRRRPDVVHVRCPDNISLLAIVLLTLLRRPRVRWVKYAGNWRPDQPEPWSYTFQRRWLEKNRHRGLVTVNGRWPGQPGHIHSFINPCLTDAEIAGAQAAAEAKSLGTPLRLICVGRLETAKGVGRALEIAARLRHEGVELTFDLVGDGPERSEFEARARALGLADVATFHGWLPRPALAPLYARSHVMLFPTSASEGWPKVLSEAMAYGVVPLAGSVSCIGQFLGEFQTGQAIPAERLDDYVAAIRRYLEQPARWKADSERAVLGAAHFTYPRYLDAVRDLLGVARPHSAPARGEAANAPSTVQGEWERQQA